MIKVLIIAPSLRKGGMERQLSYFLSNVDTAKIRPSLSLLINEVNYPIPDSINIEVLHYKPRNLFFYTRLIKMLLRNDYDLINSKISGVNEMTMLIAGLLLKAKLIIEIRNSGERLAPFYSRMKHLMNVFRFRWIVVCNNRRGYDEVNSFVPSRVKVYRISNGLDTEKFSYKPKIQSETICIGYVGRLIPRKNIECLLQAVAKLHRPWKLILKGNQLEDPLYVETLKRMADDLGISNQVRWEEESEDVSRYYHLLDIFVLPSENEGSPNVLLEAMASGTMSLCSTGANTEEYLPKELVFETHDHIGLRKKLEWIFDQDENVLEEQRLLNRRKIENEYSIKVMVDSYTELYQRYYGQ